MATQCEGDYKIRRAEPRAGGRERHRTPQRDQVGSGRGASLAAFIPTGSQKFFILENSRENDSRRKVTFQTEREGLAAFNAAYNLYVIC